jgi:hypothetical protein
MSQLTEEIIRLRKEGKTYNEIHSLTGTSKGNISYVCSKYVSDNNQLSTNNRRVHILKPHIRTAITAGHKTYYDNLLNDCKSEWANKLKAVSDIKKAYILGLYMGEGNHSGTEFTLTNSNKEIVDAFISFLAEIQAEYKTSLTIHKSMDLTECINYWPFVLDYVYQRDNRNQKKSGYHKSGYFGTITIRVVNPYGLRDALFEHNPYST